MRMLIGFAVLLTLAACGGGAPTPELYRLQPGGVEAPSCTRGASLLVEQPQAVPGLDSPRILVIDRPNHQSYYNGVRWNAPAQRVVQEYLATRAEQSGHFASVYTEATSASPDWVLEVRLRHFEVDQTGSVPQLHIAFTAQLVRASSGAVALTMPLESRADIAGQPIEQVIASFGREMDGLSDQMLALIGRSVPACR